jgi:hypothetical protein
MSLIMEVQCRSLCKLYHCQSRRVDHKATSHEKHRARLVRFMKLGSKSDLLLLNLGYLLALRGPDRRVTTILVSVCREVVRIIGPSLH